MYNVSNAYITASANSIDRRVLRGTVGNVPFTHTDILQGSISITNSISDGTEIKLGSVTSGSLKATFVNDIVPLNKWENAVISVSEGLYTGSTYEYVPLGVFKVAEANKSESGIEITAYDNMTLLDKKISIISSGKPWSFLQYVARECRIELAQTEVQIKALPNGDRTLGLYAENDIETYRDMVSWLAMTMGSYATVDRQGRLLIKPYTNTPSGTRDANKRATGGKYSAFTTRYSGLSVVKIADQSTKYVAVTPDNYLTYNMGSNPFMQYGTDSVLTAMMTEILASLQNVQYTPCECSIKCGAAYDLGDVLTLSDGIADCTTCITSYTWTFSKADNMAIKCDGKNPALANARSKSDKDLSGLMSRVSADETQYYLFTNVEDIHVGDGEDKQIINIRFTSLKSTIVVFQAEVLLEADAIADEVIGRITYEINNAAVNFYPAETWRDGKHILNLLYFVTIGEASLYRFIVKLNMEGGSADINVGDIQACISGQGLMAVDKWDGYIEIEEEIAPIQLVTPSVYSNITGDVSTDIEIPCEPSGEDTVGAIQLNSMVVDNNMVEYAFVNKRMMSVYTHQQLQAFTHEDLNTGFIHG